MPGSNHYTKKEKRQIEHIIESEMEQGKSREDAERIGYATVNKQRTEKGPKKRQSRSMDEIYWLLTSEN